MISFQNVTKIYPPDKVVLRDVSVSVSRGEIVLLTGPAGCGKSVFFQLILRKEKPSKGQVHVFGRNLSELHSKEIPYLRRRIGYIPQELHLMRPRTVIENLTGILHAIGTFGQPAEQQAKAMLSILKLDGTEKLYPSNLSRSQQQKLLIARALVLQPAIILADEPLAYLEKKDIEFVTTLLTENVSQGRILIWSSQDMNSLSNSNKKIMELKNGSIEIKESTTPVNPIQTDKVINKETTPDAD